MKKLLWLLFLAVPGLAFAQPIPKDPQLRTGKLPNGFTYYIRHNAQPQKRVELYLVNKVGSILEDDDQRGLAHFMEHMNFNGTKHYPKNQLVDHLQKAGVRFGADLNAYTSFDETVYQLPIPTDDPAMFGTGLNIMRDWAQEATLAANEIEKERGVVLEEERLGKGASDRMSRQTLPVMLNHARYAERLPIGTDEVLTKFKPEVIRRFYHDWYRPDLQALIIVGDVDVNQAEQLVKAKFADLKNPVKPRERTLYTVPLTGKTQFLAVTDKEESGTTLQIIYKHKAPAMQTEQDYLLSIKRSLFNQLLDARRNAQLSQEANPAFTGVSIGISGLLNNVDMLSFAVSVKQGQLQRGFTQAWSLLEGVKRYGFTKDELDRVKQNYLRNLQSSVSEQGKTASVSYVKEYQRLFLNSEASPGIDWEFQFAQNHLDAITLADMTALMNEYLASKDIDILIMAPEKEKTGLPDQATVTGWINTIAKQDIQQYKEEQVGDKPLLAKLPEPGKVTAKQQIPQLGVTKVTLSNGITVILKSTDFKNDQIIYGAFSPGGTSLYDNTDFDIASNVGGIMARMGLGQFNSVQLSQVLTGKVVQSSANVGLRSETINGAAAPQDLETALQLTYLQFTAPRKDSLMFRNTMEGAIASLANRYADPNRVFVDTISYVMGGYSYRSAAPTEERLRKITLQRAYDIYRERFADASNFTFVFVGNFEIDDMLPLLERYIASLPATHKHTKVRDLGIHIPSGRLVKKVFKGTENKALVRVVYSGDYQFGQFANMQLKALGDILQIKVLQRLREAEGEVYSPQVQTVYNKYPQNRFAITIQFGCAPKNADHLVALLEDEMKKLREQGPVADDVEKFKAQYQKSVELILKENSFWYSYLAGQYENNEDVLQVLDVNKHLANINPISLKQAAQTFFSGKNMITFELLPEQAGTN
ncbi:insulinase family protein [Mucilaginibacter mali]|uniref:Insulinase family protein n=1 Tax=Mucilaginibacter mali TaxID=2740462 RepID=A0A7D4QBP6_9SPHI|nr:M16 family metallopeptidase [Mucilaginibacter mali]QKJ30664.1 insulinase family protein [Mucilaginibacter mali]